MPIDRKAQTGVHLYNHGWPEAKGWRGNPLWSTASLGTRKIITDTKERGIEEGMQDMKNKRWGKLVDSYDLQGAPADLQGSPITLKPVSNTAVTLMVNPVTWKNQMPGSYHLQKESCYSSIQQAQGHLWLCFLRYLDFILFSSSSDTANTFCKISTHLFFSE